MTLAPTLSILCVTRAEPAVLGIIAELKGNADQLGARFVLVADGREAAARLPIEPDAIVHGRGFIESVLDEALGYVRSDYVLRLDDDELPSDRMIRWLDDRAFLTAEHWSFPRVHLWRDRQTALIAPTLWPDHQTRLSIKAKAGGRKSIHCGSPYGLGEIAHDIVIEHHKFLVKTIDERREIVTRYDRIEAGAGSRFRAYSVPEDLPSDDFAIVPWNGEAFAS